MQACNPSARRQKQANYRFLGFTNQQDSLLKDIKPSKRHCFKKKKNKEDENSIQGEPRTYMKYAHIRSFLTVSY